MGMQLTWGRILFAALPVVSSAFTIISDLSQVRRYGALQSLSRTKFCSTSISIKASARGDHTPRIRQPFNGTDVSVLDKDTFENQERNSLPSAISMIEYDDFDTLKEGNDVEIIKHFERSMELQFEEFSELMDELDHKESVVPNTELDDGYSFIEPSEEVSLTDSEDTNTWVPSIWQARFLLLAAAALYGTNFTFVKVLNESVPVEISTALRFGLAFLAMIPLLFFTKSSDENKVSSSDGKVAITMSSESIWKQSDLAIFIAGMETGTYNTLGYISQAVGLETTQAGTSAFICSLAVVVVPVLDYIAGKSISWKQVAGLIIAVLGVGLLEIDFSCDFTDQAMFCDSFTMGNILTLVQPFAFGLGFWRMENSLKRFPNDALKLTVGQIFAVFLGSVLYFGASYQHVGNDIPLLTHQIYDWVTNPQILGALFWTGAITTAATVYMETLAMKTLSAAETTMIFSTEPIFGSIFAAVTIGEVFGTGGMIGATAILVGVLISNMGD